MSTQLPEDEESIQWEPTDATDDQEPKINPHDFPSGDEGDKN